MYYMRKILEGVFTVIMSVCEKSVRVQGKVKYSKELRCIN